MPELEPITREEMFLDGQDLEPITREEMFIKRIYDKTQFIPEPITRHEMFLKKAGEGGSDVDIVQLNVTENGTYSEQGKAYSPVIVDVSAPLPENAYLIKDAEAPADIVTFDDGQALPMPTLKIGINAVQSGSGDPSPSNIRPISGFTEGNVSVSGVNVWDEEWELGAMNGTTGGNYPSNNSIRSKNYIPVLPNTSYYIKIPTGYINVYQYDKTQTYLGQTKVIANKSNTTITTDLSAYYIRLEINSSYGTTYNNDISINYPSTDTDYHAYNGHTTTISWEDEVGTVYGGTLDVVSGVLTVDRVYVKGEWTQYASNNGYKAYRKSVPNAKSNTMSITMPISNMISEFGSFSSASMNKNIVQLQYLEGETNVMAYMALQEDASADDVELSYLIATPTTYQLSPTAVKSLLGLNNVWADTNGEVLECQYWSKEA